jgi:hypothetical protein
MNARAGRADVLRALSGDYNRLRRDESGTRLEEGAATRVGPLETQDALMQLAERRLWTSRLVEPEVACVSARRGRWLRL